MSVKKKFLIDDKGVQAIFDYIGQKNKELYEFIREQIESLPNKDEFFGETSKIYKRQNDLEDEKEVLTYQIADRTDRIEKLEKIHPHYRHS